MEKDYFKALGFPKNPCDICSREYPNCYKRCFRFKQWFHILWTGLQRIYLNGRR